MHLRITHVAQGTGGTAKMTANNAIHQRRHLKVTSMAKALCGLVMASVGKRQTAVSPSHRPEHVKRDAEAIRSPRAGSEAMLNIQ